VGWNIVTRLARNFEVTALVGDVGAHRKNGLDLERFAREGPPVPNLRLHYIEPTRDIEFLERLHTLPGCWMFYYLAYRKWQLLALNEARRLHASTPFDLCHHLTFIGWREPGFLWKLGIPFFWGPIAGADTMPGSFYSLFAPWEAARLFSRDFVNPIQKQISPRPKQAARTAKKIWAVSQDDQRLVRSWGASCDLMLETGAASLPGATVKAREPQQPLALVWSGLMVARKALPILLRALAQLPQNWHLDVLGEGPLLGKWKKMASDMGLDSKLRWHGSLERQAALKVMADTHVLVHTGLREGTPHVVIEALSLGLPVICHNACGMGVAVNGQCGLTLPLRDPAASVAGFTSAIRRFLDEPDLLGHLSQGALLRAKELSWDGIVEKIADAYTLP